MNPQDRAALDAMSARLGADPMIVQGGGGNASVKCDDVLWVKASGTWLAHAQAEPVFVPVRLSGVRADVAAGAADPVQPNVLPLPAGMPALRPSIETTLHALLPHRVVAHVHSIHALAVAVRTDGPAIARERLHGLDWAFLPYARPGLCLTEAVAALGPRFPDVLLLGSHGLVVGADDCAAAEARIRDVEARLRVRARPCPSADLARLSVLADAQGLALPEDPRLHALAIDPVACERALRGVLFPDQVVFLGPRLALLGDDTVDSPCRLVPGQGVLVDRALTPGQAQLLLCLALLHVRLPADATLAWLPDDEVAALLGWEAERYRKALDAARRG